MDYKTMWENLRDFIDEAVQEGKDRGFDNVDSAYYDGYCIFERVDEVMEYNELTYGGVE